MRKLSVKGTLFFSFVAVLPVSGSAASLAITTPSALGTYTIGQAQIFLNATGGTGNYTWSLASGTLPTGLSIRQIPGNSPAQTGLVGIAVSAGNYAFSLTVNDGSTSVTQAFTARITALTVANIGLPDAFSGTAYSYSLTALNNAAPVTFAVTSPALPPGLSLSAAGVLSGTPTTGGVYNINFSVTDGIDTTYRGFQFLVYAVQLTTSGQLPNATQGISYSTALAASGGAGGYQYAVTGGSLPFGLSLSGAGVISGTTGVNAGLYSFSVTVTDTGHNSYQKTMAIDVVASPSPQAEISLGTIDDVVLGNNYGWQIPTCCGGVAPFTWSASGLPAGLSIRSGSGVTSNYVTPGWGEIWGVASIPGDYNVTATVTDSTGASASLTFPMHVSVLNLAPNYNLPGATINSQYSSTFQIIGGSAPYSVAQIGGFLPDGLALNTASAAAGSFIVAGSPVESGNFDPEFRITDGAGNTLSRNNYFTINNPGGITINNNTDLGSTTPGVNYSFQFNACCAPGYVWTVASGAIPPGLTLSSSGLLSGPAGGSGIYTFLVKVADSTGVASPGFRQFQLNVSPIAITTNSLPYGNLTSAYSTSFAANGGTGTLTWSVAFGYYLPPGLTLATNGALSGTPTATGQYYFGIIAADQSGHTAIRYYDVNIYPAGGSPPPGFAVGPNLGTWHLGTQFIGLGANGGNGTYTWNLVSGTLPPGMAISTNRPNFFSPNQQAGIIGVATTPGNYSFTLSVTSAGQTATRPFTLRMSGLDLQDVALQDAFVNISFTHTFTPLNNAGPVTYTVNGNSTNGAMPPGLSLSGSGVLSGTPTAAGNYVVAMNISDGTDTQYEQYNLYVYAVNIITSGTLPNAVQGGAYSTTLTATGGAGGYAWRISGGGLPNGLTLSSTGAITGNATTGPGPYGFTVTATDTNNASYSRQMSLDVIASPAVPFQIGGFAFNDAVVGERYGWAPGLCCGGTAPFTWTVTGLPTGLTTEPNSNSYLQYPSSPGSVQIYGVPQTVGTYNVTMTVKDASGATSSVTAPLHVSPLDVTLPSTGSAYNLPNGTINLPYSATFSVIGGTGPYSFSQTIMGELPDGLGINSGTLTVSGTPVENGFNFYPGFLFADSTGNTLYRSEGIAIAGAGGSTITVNGNGYYGYFLGTTTVGFFYSTQFSACCAASYVWSVAPNSTLPPGLTLSSSGTLSGTPTAPGSYTILLDAADASNSVNVGVKSFVLVVTPIQITTSFLPAAVVGTSYTASLAATGGTGSLTWTQLISSSSPLPPGLTLTVNGTISGTPSSTGAYNVIIQVTDTSGNMAIRSFVINVSSVPLQLITLTPCRIIDTRNANGPLGGPFISGETSRTIPIPSSACNVPVNAAAYSLNVTVVPRKGTLGYLTVWPTGQAQPLVSTLNSLDGSVLANAAIVPAGTAGAIDAFATDDTDLVVDINGYFAPPAANTLQFYPLTPCRVFDTRDPDGTFGGPSLAGAETRSFPIASSSCGRAGERGRLLAQCDGCAAWRTRLSQHLADGPAAAPGVDPELSRWNDPRQCRYRTGGHQWLGQFLCRQSDRCDRGHQRIFRAARGRRT